MKSSVVPSIAAAFLIVFAVPALAHPEMHMKMAGHQTSAAVATLTGELVDTGCYLGSAERGAKHVSCATKCISQGMPMGLLTADGTLYLLTMNHDNPDPYNELKNMAGKTVRVTGAVMSRGGMKGIDVSAFKPGAAVAAK